MMARQCWGFFFLVIMSASLTFADVQPDAMPYPPLPEGISSFGAATAGDYLYVFGGHMGRVPGNSVDGLSPHFCRLQLSEPQKGWEELPMHISSQSPGLVSWNGAIYRIAGLSFRNKAGEETNFHSLDTFAKFDPATKTWVDLPSLPTPRSSLDAAVVDGKLYVVGGWNLQEGSAQSAPWHETALVFDLANEQGKWEEITAPPFQTRALAVASHKHRLYVLGGMNSNNQTTRAVHIYDPQTKAWTAGPELKSANNFGGFAISAYEIGGHLYYCGGDGTVYGLNEAGDGWNPVERVLFSRMFHRVAPAGENKLAVIAGVSGGGYLSSLEVVNLEDKKEGNIKSASWTMPFPGRAKHSQILVVHAGSLFAFGGNSSPKPHDFAQENFVDEVFEFDLSSRTVEQRPNLPVAVQSGAGFVAGRRIDQSIYVLGGLAFRDGKSRSTDVIQQYRLRSKGWSEDLKHLPESRAMFGLATHKGSAWIVGGSQVGTENTGLTLPTWEWNPVAAEPLAPVPEAALTVGRRSLGTAVLENRLYVIGGLGEKSAIIPTADVYDFETKQWSQVAAPASARVFPNLVAAGGKLYLSGGFSRVDGHFAGTTDIEVYDPKTNTWSKAFEELAPTLAEMSLLAYQDRLLFYSIDRDQGGVAHFIMIDPEPMTIGSGALAVANEESTEATDLATRLLRMDANKDGRLTPEEVGTRFTSLIQRADTDKDGTASREEIEAYVRRQEESGRERPGRDGGGERPEGRRGGNGERPEGRRGERPAGTPNANP